MTNLNSIAATFPWWRAHQHAARWRD